MVTHHDASLKVCAFVACCCIEENLKPQYDPTHYYSKDRFHYFGMLDFHAPGLSFSRPESVDQAFDIFRELLLCQQETQCPQCRHLEIRPWLDPHIMN